MIPQVAMVLGSAMIVALAAVFAIGRLPWIKRYGIGRGRRDAVTVALRERLQREKRARSAERRLREMRAIAERCAKLLGPGPSAVEHGDVLYDERGLPE